VTSRSPDDRYIARIAGVVAVLAAALFGLSLIVVAAHRDPNRLDRWGDRAARQHFDLAQAHSALQLGSPLVVGAMLVLLSLVGWQSALRSRALVITAGGAFTCLFTDHVVQEIVQRYRVFGFVDSYPSGHVTGVAVVGLCAAAMVTLLGHRCGCGGDAGRCGPKGNVLAQWSAPGRQRRLLFAIITVWQTKTSPLGTSVDQRK
jgi:hypothetical protein